MPANDERFMRAALAMGQRGLGRVWPWPSVGCVIVRDGRMVGRGVSDPQTLRHAERVALDQAGEAAHGATAYVTLEPCSHYGRTPPCADALVSAGIARVVVALGDPNTLVNGQGLARLRAAGVEVTEGVCRAEAAAQHAGFLSVIQRGRPAVTLKLAASLDGRIATASGESRWITSAPARRMVHLARSRHDAVLVGGGTARKDDPTLTVRDLGLSHQPVRIVLSRRLDLPEDGKLARTIGEAPLWLLHGRDTAPDKISAWAGRGAHLIAVDAGPGRQIDPGQALAALGQAGLTRVYCEGGSSLAASLLSAELVDELHLFTAGKALGAEGTPMLGALGLGRLADAPGFNLIECRAVGPDTFSRWQRKPA